MRKTYRWRGSLVETLGLLAGDLDELALLRFFPHRALNRLKGLSCSGRSLRLSALKVALITPGRLAFFLEAFEDFMALVHILTPP